MVWGVLANLVASDCRNCPAETEAAASDLAEARNVIPTESKLTQPCKS